MPTCDYEIGTTLMNLSSQYKSWGPITLYYYKNLNSDYKIYYAIRTIPKSCFSEEFNLNAQEKVFSF